MKFINLFKSNFYKIAHSNLLWLHIVVPLIGILLFITLPWQETKKLLVYFQTVATAFPLLIAIVTSMSSEEELNAGSFQNILSVPCSKAVVHLNKLSILSVFGFLATILAVGGFGIIFILMGNKILGLFLYVKIAIILFLSNFSLYVIQYMISYNFGKGISLGLGTVGSLLSSLLSLSLGDGIWYFIPYGWGIRLGTYSAYKYMNLGLSNVFIADFKIGVISMAIISSILLIIFLIWGKKWEGKSFQTE